jgi:iduronate 2-sulfatase
MTRRIQVLFCVALLAVCFCAQADTTASARLNVLFIACDDLRNDLGCYGDTLVKTPNLDRLAQRGLVFNRAYCQQALCNPSRASLLTGRRPDSLRIWDLPTHFRATMPEIVTLPQHFKNNGYFTQNIGKIFHNFRQEIPGDPASWSVPAVMHFTRHDSDTPLMDGPIPPNSAKDPKCECRDVPDEAYFDGRVAKLAVEALRERKATAQPFFLAVGFWKPHSPFNAPKRYWDLYRRDEVPLSRNADWPKDAPRVAWHNGRELRGDEQRELTPEAVREIRHGYFANVSYLDAQIGKVLDELHRLGLADKTIVVFWSDHGYHLGEKTLWAKTSNFELDARVPLIIARPNQKSAGKTTESLAELLDLYPTLVDLYGLPKVAGLEGVSLAPVLTSPRKSVRAAALTQHPRPAYYQGAPETMGYSVRTDRFRYTEWRDWKTGETIARELYDHWTDPDETRNVAGDPNRAQDVAGCAGQLNKFNPVVQPGWRPLLPRRFDLAQSCGHEERLCA